MIRIVLAAMAALALSACNPSVKADPADPWKTLLPWNHSWAEVQKLPNGVEYIVLKKGDGKGDTPKAIDQVEVNYDGRLAENGLKFDSSYDRNEPATFQLNGVIPGWTEGLQKMHVGDVFMFWIPWKEAYGADGRGVEIPPIADLMFKVELLKIMPAVTSDDKAWAKVTPWPTGSADVVRRPSGLEYLPVRNGDSNSATPADTDEVIVHLQGRPRDGREGRGRHARRYPPPLDRRRYVRGPGARVVPGQRSHHRLERACEADAQGRPLDGAHAAGPHVWPRGRWTRACGCDGDLRSPA